MIDIDVARALFGLLVFAALAWLLSERRRSFAWRPLLMGLAYQVLFALILLQVPAATAAFAVLAHAVDAIQSSAVDGASFVFGYLAGGEQPFERASGGSSSIFIFAFQALPAILLVGALAALLWHWHVLRYAVRAAAWVFGRLFGVSGAVGVSTSACIFLGMVEAPLLVRPMLPKMSRGELFILMVDGMSVIAGSMMILLGTVLAARIPDAFTHLVIASLISTPMAIGMARAIVPTDPPQAAQRLELESEYRNGLEALTGGALNALHMALNILALLVVFVGLIALVNRGLSLIHYGQDPLSLATLFGWLFSPVAWLMGIPSGELQAAGALLGTKVSTNEVVAYSQLAALPEGTLGGKSTLIMTYALCSFGNIGSVAILVGTFRAIVPERSREVVQLGFKALAAAFLTSCVTGSVIGILHSLT